MKKLFILVSIFIATNFVIGSAQGCFEELNVALNIDGVILVNVESLVEGDINDYSDLSFEVLFFDCSQIGENDYEVTGTYLGSPYSCSGKIIVEDKTEPIAICAPDRQPIFSTGVDTIWLESEYIDENSYDNCSIQSIEITPLFITRDDIGVDVLTTLNITDSSGNMNASFSTLTAEEGEAQLLSCIGLLEVKIGPYPYPVERGEVLNMLESEIGPNLILTLRDEVGNLIKDNLVTEDYIGQELTFTVTDMYTHNICFGMVEVDCAPFLICDVNSACSVAGDCESGHSDSDNVEWPCDLDLEVPFNGSIEEVPDLLTEDYLINVLGRETLGTIVDVVGFANQCILISYVDSSPIPIDATRVKFVRNWTLLDFVSGTPYEYVQLLDVTIVPFIEEDSWPSDIEVDDIRILPEELIRISHISPYEAYPNIGYQASYNDQFVSDNGSKLEVDRTWTAISGGVNIGSHVQRITANYSDLLSTVSIQGVDDVGISDVIVNDLEYTDESGLAFTAVVPAELVLDPTLDKRINIRDLKALRRAILTLDVLNNYQTVSGDFDESGTLSSVDYLLMQETILGESPYQVSSSFIDKEIVDPSLPVYVENKLLIHPGDVVQESICPAYFEHSTVDLTLNIDSKQVEASSTDCVFMYASGYEGINSAQWKLEYDPSVILVTDVKQFDSQELFFLVNATTPGEVTILSGHFEAYTADPCIPLMEICYDVVGEVGQSTELRFVLNDPNTIIEVTVSDENGLTTPLDLKLMDGTISIVDSSKIVSKPYQLTAEDKLLNQGESYSIDFFLQDFEEATDGIQVKVIVEEAIDIESVNIESSQDFELVFYVSDERQLTILMQTAVAEVFLDLKGDDPVFNLSFNAAENGLLSTSILAIGEYSTFISDASRSIYLLDVSISNALTTSIHEIESSNLIISPNPVVDQLYLSLAGQEADYQDIKVSIRSVNGIEVLSQNGLSPISLQHLPTGVYLIQVLDGNQLYSSKFSKFE